MLTRAEQDAIRLHAALIDLVAEYLSYRGVTLPTPFHEAYPLILREPITRLLDWSTQRTAPLLVQQDAERRGDTQRIPSAKDPEEPLPPDRTQLRLAFDVGTPVWWLRRDEHKRALNPLEATVTKRTDARVQITIPDGTTTWVQPTRLRVRDDTPDVGSLDAR